MQHGIRRHLSYTLLGGLCKTAARRRPWWTRSASDISEAQAQRFEHLNHLRVPHISELNRGHPLYKLYKDLDSYKVRGYLDGAQEYYNEIDKFLKAPNLSPDIRAELEATQDWLRPLRDREVKVIAERHAEARAEWEKYWKTDAPEALSAAGGFYHSGAPMTKEDAEDLYRIFVKGQIGDGSEVSDYVLRQRQDLAEYLNDEDFARIEASMRSAPGPSSTPAAETPDVQAPPPTPQPPPPPQVPQTGPANPSAVNRPAGTPSQVDPFQVYTVDTLSPDTVQNAPSIPFYTCGPSQHLQSWQLNGGGSANTMNQMPSYTLGAGPVVPKTAPPPPSPPTPQKSFIRDTPGNVLSLGSYPTLMPLRVARQCGVPGLAWVPKASTKGSQFTGRDWLVHAGGATAASQAGAFDTLGPNLWNTGACVWNFITDPSYYNAGQVIGNVGEAYELCYTEDLS